VAVSHHHLWDLIRFKYLQFGLWISVILWITVWWWCIRWYARSCYCRLTFERLKEGHGGHEASSFQVSINFFEPSQPLHWSVKDLLKISFKWKKRSLKFNWIFMVCFINKWWLSTKLFSSKWFVNRKISGNFSIWRLLPRDKNYSTCEGVESVCNHTLNLIEFHMINKTSMHTALILVILFSFTTDLSGNQGFFNRKYFKLSLIRGKMFNWI
jgi:hypothetical protein